MPCCRRRSSFNTRRHQLYLLISVVYVYLPSKLWKTRNYRPTDIPSVWGRKYLASVLVIAKGLSTILKCNINLVDITFNTFYESTYVAFPSWVDQHTPLKYKTSHRYDRMPWRRNKLDEAALRTPHMHNTTKTTAQQDTNTHTEAGDTMIRAWHSKSHSRRTEWDSLNAPLNWQSHRKRVRNLNG